MTTDSYVDLQAMGEIEDIREYHRKLAALAENRVQYPRTDAMQEMIERQLGRVEQFLGERVLTESDREVIAQLMSLLG